MCRCIRDMGVVLAVAASCGATSGFANTTHTVDLLSMSFSPDSSVIQVGDTVHWVWVTGSHNVESGVTPPTDGNFNSGLPTAVVGTTYDVTFDQQFLDDNPMPGNVYPYYCVVHVGFGMTGTITVEVPPVPALSEWGLAAMVLLMLGAGAVIVVRRRAPCQAD